MCINDPDLWNNNHGWMLEEACSIWEKINCSNIKNKRLTSAEKSWAKDNADVLESYTRVAKLYSLLSEEEKDEIYNKWNAVIQKAAK